MDSLSPQVVSAAKLPILNPNEFDLWKMRIEQYFLMTDYSLWEVILNGDSPVPTRLVEGVVQPVSLTSAKQKLARKNELKAHGCKRLSALQHKTTDSVSAAASVYAICAKLPVSSLPNVDSLSNAVIYSFFASQSTSPQLDNEDLKHIDTSRNLSDNGPTSMGFDMFKVKCYNCHKKGHFAREWSYDWSYQAEKEPANFSLMAFSPSSSSSDTESDCDNRPPSSLYDTFQPSGGYHAVPPPTTGTFMPPKPDLVFHTAPIAVETDHSAFTVQLSPSKPAQDLSHTNRPSAPIIEDWVFDYEDESETEVPQIVPSFVQSFEQVKTPRHSVQPVKTSIPASTPKPTSPKSNSSGKRRNRKTCFVCKSVDHLIKDSDYHAKKMAQPTPRNYAHMGNNKQNASLTHKNPPKHMDHVAVLTQSKSVSITVVRPVSAAVPKIMMTRPRLAHPIVTKSKSPIRRHITRSQSPKTSNSPPRVTVVQALVVSAAQGNMSYLSDFEELNGGYVAFGGNPKGGKISGKGKIKTCKLDFEDVYFVKEQKFNLFSVSQMCDKKTSVLFTDTECLVLSPDFKLPDESQVLLRNRVLVTKPHNKTLYELLHGRTPSISFVRPFGCPVTILNTLDSLGKFEGKVDEGFLVGYSPNITGSGPTWLFDIDSLTRTMNYQLVTVGNQTNPNVSFQDNFDAEKAWEEINQQYVLFPVWSSGSTNPQNYDGDAAFDGKEHDFDAKKPESEVILSPSNSAQSRKQDDKTKKKAKGNSPVESFIGYRDLSTYTNPFSVVGPSNTTASPTHGKSSFIDASQLPDDPDMPELEDITYSDDENDVGVETDFNNLETSITISPIPTTTVHKDHHISQIIGDLSSTTQTRSMTRVVKDDGRLSQMLLSFTGGTQEVARIEPIRLFLAYASFMGFMVYQMDVKSAFLYGTIEEKVYVCQPLGVEDPDHPDKVYKVVNAVYGLHQALRAWYETLANYLLENGFQRGKIDKTLFIKKQKGDILLVQIYIDDIIFCATNKDLCKSFEKLMKDKFQMTSMGELTFFLGLQVKQKKDGIFINQDKYVAEILRMFGLIEGKSASTPIDIEKPLLKDPDGKDVDVHTYMSMIGSLMYLTSSRPDIMFAYPKDSPFDLVSYSDSDYDGVSLDRKFTTRGCQFLGCILISWQCKKQIVVATSSTEAEYVTAASCCAQVNDITRLQALVDKKKVVVTEAAIREALRLDDAEGVDCLPNEEEGDADEHVEDVTTGGDDAQGDDTIAHGEVPTRVDTSDDTVMDDESNQGRMIDEMDKDDDAVVLMDEKEEDKKVEEAKVYESAQVQGRQAKSQAKIYKFDMDHASKVLLTAASAIIFAAEPQVPAATITVAPAKVATVPSRKRNGVQQIEMDEEYARKFHDELNKDIDYDVAIDHVKLQAKEDPDVQRYQVMKRKPKQKTKKQIEEEENRALQNINETPAQKAAKRRKLNEEVEDLKRHMEIVPDEDDDVYTEATPLARKVPIVDYEIIELKNKPYYKIIRADGTHQLYISFLTLLKNFNREDLKCCQAKLMLLDNAAEARLMLLKQD
nr:putative ribonuclease H-like domain-containing protein [Tanacetum cinerariifolium]